MNVHSSSRVATTEARIEPTRERPSGVPPKWLPYEPRYSTKKVDYSTQGGCDNFSEASSRVTRSQLCHVRALSDAFSDVLATILTNECLPVSVRTRCLC